MMKLASLQDNLNRERKPNLENEKMTEWNPRKRWNPFNSYKMLSHVHRWSHIKRGRPIPPPILITVDPTNTCNFNCLWCNALSVREERKLSLSKDALLGLAEFLPSWGRDNPCWKNGVEAVCVAGGGEPLLNPSTGIFIDRLIENGIEAGIVTNGSLIQRHIDSLSLCTWIGVSVDASTKKTFNIVKGLPQDSDMFDLVIENMAILIDYAKSHNNILGLKHSAYGVSFKYLLHPENISEIYSAARLAKEIGCKNIHFRPAGTTWDKLGTKDEIVFSDKDIATFEEQISQAMELDDDDFGVYGITHKFNSQFTKSNHFNRCHAIFMTAVISPPSSKDSAKDSFIISLCCDRRGDSKLELATDITDFEEINRIWGSHSHWKMHDAIMIDKECPRCTYQPHNEIYEQVILNDSMTYRFI